MPKEVQTRRLSGETLEIRDAWMSVCQRGRSGLASLISTVMKLKLWFYILCSIGCQTENCWFCGIWRLVSEHCEYQATNSVINNNTCLIFPIYLYQRARVGAYACL